MTMFIYKLFNNPKWVDLRTHEYNWNVYDLISIKYYISRWNSIHYKFMTLMKSMEIKVWLSKFGRVDQTK